MLTHIIILVKLFMHQKTLDILKHNNKLHLLFCCFIGFTVFIVMNINIKLRVMEDNFFYLVGCFASFVPLLFVRKGENKWLMSED